MPTQGETEDEQAAKIHKVLPSTRVPPVPVPVPLAVPVSVPVAVPVPVCPCPWLWVTRVVKEAGTEGKRLLRHLNEY